MKPIKEFTFGYDIENVRDVQNYVLDNYRNKQDFRMSIGYGDDIMNSLEIYNPVMLKDEELLDLIGGCEKGGRYNEGSGANDRSWFESKKFDQLYRKLIDNE